MNSKSAFRKIREEQFAICSLEAEKGWVGIEPEHLSYGLYHYVVKGSAKFGVPFKDGYDLIKKGDFYCTKNKLYDAFMMEAVEDFYIIGFSTLDKEQDWDGIIVKDKIVRVKKESVLICLDGSPIVEDQELSAFDYGKLEPYEEYEVDTTDGVLALFTRN